MLFLGLWTIFTVNFLLSVAIRESCRKVSKFQLFPAKGVECKDFAGSYSHWLLGGCYYSTCFDLKDHQDDKYCGQGTCRLFLGIVDCDQGCINFSNPFSKFVYKWLYKNHYGFNQREEQVTAGTIFLIKYILLGKLDRKRYRFPYNLTLLHNDLIAANISMKTSN